jgi:hypothetical protein
MTTNLQLQTFVANARKSVRDREQVSIGGGVFDHQEVGGVVQGLQALETARSALQEISELLKKHPEFSKGNSTVHYSAHRAMSALSAIPTDKPAAQALPDSAEERAQQARSVTAKKPIKNKP